MVVERDEVERRPDPDDGRRGVEPAEDEVEPVGQVGSLGASATDRPRSRPARGRRCRAPPRACGGCSRSTSRISRRGRRFDEDDEAEAEPLLVGGVEERELPEHRRVVVQALLRGRAGREAGARTDRRMRVQGLELLVLGEPRGDLLRVSKGVLGRRPGARRASCRPRTARRARRRSAAAVDHAREGREQERHVVVAPGWTTMSPRSVRRSRLRRGTRGDRRPRRRPSDMSRMRPSSSVPWSEISSWPRKSPTLIPAPGLPAPCRGRGSRSCGESSRLQPMLPGDLVHVGADEAPLPHDLLAADVEAVDAVRRRQHEPGDRVLGAAELEAVGAPDRDVRALAGLERADVVASEDGRTAPGRQAQGLARRHRAPGRRDRARRAVPA